MEEDMESGGGHDVSQPSTHSQPSENSELETRLTSSKHLRILSSPPGMMGDQNEAAWPPYTFDPTLGLNQTIYIVDRGFNRGKSLHIRAIMPAIRALHSLSYHISRHRDLRESNEHQRVWLVETRCSLNPLICTFADTLDAKHRS